MRTTGNSFPASSIPNTALTRGRRSQLVRVLENYERQLRRQIEHGAGNSEVNAQLNGQFARYRKVIVHEFFWAVPMLPTRFARLRRQLFQKLVTIEEEALNEAGEQIPPPKELRKLVSAGYAM